jgi:hypothetical protein
MKGVKKSISLAAVMLVAGSMAFAQTRPVYKTGTAVMPAGETNLYVNVEGLKVVGDDLLLTYLKLDEVAFKNVSGTATGTVTFYSVDLNNDNQMSQIASVIPGAFSSAYPRREIASQTINTADWVVTGDVAVAVSVSTVTTNYVPYTFRQLKLFINQAETSATDNVYQYLIKAE